VTARLAAATLALLAGCVLVPHTVEGYDPECRTVARTMVLQPVQIASIQGCSNQGCAVLLAAAGATAAASAVISGSIVVAGNVVYWLEKQGRCQRG
jgi:starvation-inducible outer membrane lipoprotein